MAVGDLYHVNCEMDNAGNTWSWGFDYQQVSGTNDAFTLDEFAVAFNLFHVNEVLGVLALGSYWRMTDVRPLPGVDEIPGSAPPPGQGGTNVQGPMPSNMAIKLHWITNAPNSRYNGMTNFSGCPTLFNNDGIVTGQGLAAFNTLIANLLQNIGGVGDGNAEFQPVIISRWANGEKRPQPVPYAIESGSVSTRWGNMRRRTTERRLITL